MEENKHLVAIDDVVTAAGTAQKALEGLNAAVRTARREGMTWEQLGKVLGTTRQAAQQRFGSTTGE